MVEFVGDLMLEKRRCLTERKENEERRRRNVEKEKSFGRRGENIWEWPVLGGRGKCTRWRPMLPTAVTQQLDKGKVTGG